MTTPVYIAGVGLTKVDLTGRVFASIFDLFEEAYAKALARSEVRAFGALQLGVMDSEEFVNRANIAAKVADRLGLRGIPAVRTETASSTGAAALHEACAKIAAGQCESVLVLAGERMKNVTTQVATGIMSKTVDPVERRFGFTMPGLIALVTRAWLREQGLSGDQARALQARLMVRAHALGSKNPLAAFSGRPEALDAYFDTTRNLPVATPLLRKDCSPICDGAAAVILTARPQPLRVVGLGAATDSSSILDRTSLAHLDATRSAAQHAYAQAGVSDARTLEGLVVEAHDAFNPLLPIDLVDLGLVAPEQVLPALVGPLDAPPLDPLTHPVSGPRGSLPVNLSGGLKARGHPVGGTGLFQIVECALQLLGEFPNPDAQASDARIGLAHSIGGPGNNVYVTLIERSDSARLRAVVERTRPQWQARRVRPAPADVRALDGAHAVIEAATTIHVTADGVEGPVQVALVRIGDQRVFARLDDVLSERELEEEALAGQSVRLLVKDDGDHYVQLHSSWSRVLRSVRALRREAS